MTLLLLESQAGLILPWNWGCQPTAWLSVWAAQILRLPLTTSVCWFVNPQDTGFFTEFFFFWDEKCLLILSAKVLYRLQKKTKQNKTVFYKVPWSLVEEKKKDKYGQEDTPIIQDSFPRAVSCLAPSIRHPPPAWRNPPSACLKISFLTLSMPMVVFPLNSAQWAQISASQPEVPELSTKEDLTDSLRMVSLWRKKYIMFKMSQQHRLLLFGRMLFPEYVQLCCIQRKRFPRHNRSLDRWNLCKLFTCGLKFEF